MGRAVVLLSGGLDSATALAIAQERGHECYALSFFYGQRHVTEIHAAYVVARMLRARDHRVVQVDLATLGGSALTDPNIAVPKDEEPSAIPITYVPARNSVFLAVAFGWAEVLGADRVFAGMNVLDYSGYPDCRPEFLASFQEAMHLGTRPESRGIEICAPLIHMSKAEIIREGSRLGVPFEVTSSCYDPKGDLACGHCDACRLRTKGFQEANIQDPTRYA